MENKGTSRYWQSFAVRIVFPTILTVILFLTSIFSIVIPAIEKNSLDRKREMIRELTNSAWNILAQIEHKEQRGLLTRAEAQQEAIEQIRNLHYGEQMKDYFWINDMHPRMVVHPYRPDLDGGNLSDYRDSDGKRIFVEMVNVVKASGSGYVYYMWQWKDDQERIAPKISYVKGFSPWEWIIGTGVYIEDVKAEIRQISNNIIYISLFIFLIMSFMLTTIIFQSYRTEQFRRLAEEAMRESEEKYRTLVESATEGMLMALEGKYMYANQTIANLLEYDIAEFNEMPVAQIFADANGHPSYKHVEDLIAGKALKERFEARMKTKSGEIKEVILSSSQISIGGKTGFMAVATDITKRKQAEGMLEESEQKFRTMANNLNIGLFRRTVGRNPRFIEVNPAMVKLLGYSSREELLGISALDLYLKPEERKVVEPKGLRNGLEREIVTLKRKDGSPIVVSIWAVSARDEFGEPVFVDGIVEDITESKAREEERENLLTEMQTAMHFLNQPLENLQTKEVAFCSSDTLLRDAAELMDDRRIDSLVIVDRQGSHIGMVTEVDLGKSLISRGSRPDDPVTSIMSSPIVSIDEKSSVFEAGYLMEQNNTSHVLVTDGNGSIRGVVRSRDISAIQKYSPAVLLHQIQGADTAEAIIKCNSGLPLLLTVLINCGTKPQHINHLTTVFVDAVRRRLIELAIQELGSPPAEFDFIVFGSEGRQEQTLKTDQDNAIIYQDVAPEAQAGVNEYFLALGKKVCAWLDQAGYAYCDGGNMAQNPQWCQPLSVWKRYFSEWITQGTAEDLLKAKIFFDFRSGYGEEALGRELREHLYAVIARNPRFFQLLARNVLQHSPPIGLFGKFILENVGTDRKVFDIKASMILFVDYARIYSLHHSINATNTFERLRVLHERDVLTLPNYQEMLQAYSYLMQIRLQTQARSIATNGKPDNYVSPSDLTYIEQKLIKEIMNHTKNFQARLSYDFTGQLKNT